MNTAKLHLHSMMVHSIAALSPVAAVSFVLLKLDISFLSFDEKTWSFLVALSIVLSLLISLPSLASGVFERGHRYVKWHPSHQAKLLLSLLLIAMLVLEVGLISSGALAGETFSLIGILLIFGNNIAVFLLSKYGLKISMGRQSLGKTSYEPDMLKAEPVDILETAAVLKNEEPKYLDLLVER